VTKKERNQSKTDSDPVDLDTRRRNSSRSRTRTNIERRRALRLKAEKQIWGELGAKLKWWKEEKRVTEKENWITEC